MEFTVTWMELNMKETGKAISSTDKVLRHGQMVPNMMDNTFMERSMDKVDLLGLTVAHTSDNSKRTTFKVTVLTTGQMEECSSALGSTIKWKDMVHSRGQTEENTKETILMIRKRDKVPSIGQMVENMKVDGKTESNMGMEITPQQVEKSNKEDGMKARDSIGLVTVKMHPVPVKQPSEGQFTELLFDSILLYSFK